MEKLEEGQRNYAASGGRGHLEDWLITSHGCLKVIPRLSKHVQFYQHSLNHDGPFNEFQLIVCRNVMTYFHTDLQVHVMDLFSRSLHQEGFLMLGPSEGISQGAGERFFGTYAAREKIYRWRDMGVH